MVLNSFSDCSWVVLVWFRVLASGSYFMVSDVDPPYPSRTLFPYYALYN